MLARADVWIPGLVLGAVLAFVIRPVLVGLCLAPAGWPPASAASSCSPGSRARCRSCWASCWSRRMSPTRERLYGIVVVVVVFSVLVQGSLVPAAARLLRLPMYPVEPEPWALGVRLRDEPERRAPPHGPGRLAGRRAHHR